MSIKEITEKEDLSPIFLEQIFTKLKKFGLIRSVRGVGGGFLLNREISEITVNDILEAVEEGVCLAPCCTDDDDEDIDYRVRSFWNASNAFIMKYFESYTLERLLSEFGEQTAGDSAPVSPFI